MTRIVLLLICAAPMSGAPANTAEEPGGVALRLAIQLTIAALVPMFFVTLTPFLRISVVLHFLRQALGTQTVPSNQVVIGLSALLVMLEVGLPRRLLVLLEVGVGLMPARCPRLPALRGLRGPRGGTDRRPGRAVGEKTHSCERPYRNPSGGGVTSFE